MNKNKGNRIAKGVEIKPSANIDNISIGRNSFIDAGVTTTGRGKKTITIGKETYIGIGTVLDRSGGLEIGNFVHIAGPGTGVWTHSSIEQALSALPLESNNERIVEAVVIEDCVWIGGGCTIYPGVKIHHHSAVLPGSVVNRDVKSWTVVGGAPAKIVRKIKIKNKKVIFLK